MHMHMYLYLHMLIIADLDIDTDIDTDMDVATGLGIDIVIGGVGFKAYLWSRLQSPSLGEQSFCQATCLGGSIKLLL